MSKWHCCVSVTIDINYDDIEAETEEEAKQIAEQKAEEDVDYNNGELSDVECFCAWEDEEDAEIH